MATPETEIVVEDPTAPADDSPSVVSTRTVEIVVSLLLLALAVLLGYDNWRTGIAWASDGPQAGYFPFYLGLILAAASLYGLVSRAGDRRRRRRRHSSPATQLRRVMQVFVPTLAVLPAHAMARALRRELPADRGLHARRRPHRAVEVAAHRLPVRRSSCSSPSTSRSTSSCRKGRSKRPSATRIERDGSLRPAASRLLRPADVEDPGADDGRARARHLRRRAAGTGRPERRRDPAAADVHDGPDLGHRHAVLHLLGRAVRRRHHLDPVQHSGRGLVGGDHLRRLSDGAAGQGGRGADRGVHVVVHRLAGRGAADHVPGARHRLVRAAVRTAGILRGLSADVLLVRRPRPRGQAQDHHLDGARPAARRRRHGYGVRHAAHDLRLERAAARHQFPGRGHRPVRHQRNPAHDGGAARAARPRRQHQPARGAARCGRNCRATG